jgi:hypothetical protein
VRSWQKLAEPLPARGGTAESVSRRSITVSGPEVEGHHHVKVE